MKSLWYKKDLSQITTELGVDVAVGLTQKHADEQLRQFGKNRISLQRKRNAALPFLLPSLLLITALFVLICAFVKFSTTEALLFLAIYVAFAAIVAFALILALQNKSEIRSRFASNVTVMRGGMRIQIPSELLVPGDIIFLKRGDTVPADAYILRSNDLAVLEGPVTDNYAATAKRAGVLQRSDLAYSEMSNLLFATSVISYGECASIVFATGRNAAIVDVAAKRTELPKPYFLKNLTRFAVIPNLITVSFAILSFIFTFAYSAFDNVTRAGLVSLMLFCSALSLLLPHIAEIAFAIRNRSRGAFYRTKGIDRIDNLSAIDLLAISSEALLSERNLEASALFTANEKSSADGFLEKPSKDLQTLTLIAQAAEGITEDDAVFNHDQLHLRSYRRAVLNFASKKFQGAKNAYRHVTYRLADTGFRFDTSIVSVADNSFAVMKGNYRSILSSSSYVLSGGRYKPLDPATERELTDLAARFEAMGFEVVAYARSAAECSDLNNPIGIHSQMHFIGMFAMCRKQFEDNSDFFEDCRSLAIRPVILHDGYKNSFIATFKDADWFADLRICDGRDLVGTQTQIADVCDSYDVFCALNEKQKHDLIRAFERGGHCTGVLESTFADYFMSAGADVIFADIRSARAEKAPATLEVADALTVAKATTLTAAIKNSLQTVRCTVNAVKYLFISILLRALLVFIGAAANLSVLSPAAIIFFGLIVDSAALGTILTEPFRNKKERVLDRNSYVSQFTVGASFLLPFITLFFGALPILILYFAGRPMSLHEVTSYVFLAMLLISACSVVFYCRQTISLSILLSFTFLVLFVIALSAFNGLGALFAFTPSALTWLALIPAAIYVELCRFLPMLANRFSRTKNHHQSTIND